MKKAIMYGAGNIGRGFIGQLFSMSGYEVGFIDINESVINELNSFRRYPLNIVDSDNNTETFVENVYGILGKDNEVVSDAIRDCDIMATAIGVNVLKFIAKPIAMGIKKRIDSNKKPLNIIICENLLHADKFLLELIKKELPEEYHAKLASNLGLVEASIGRMVPAITEDKKLGSNLRVYVEPYNVLPVDIDAFVGELPKIENLYPFSPFSLFIQRKLFMHNMSHATTAYLGYMFGDEFIYESIERAEIRVIIQNALSQSSVALSKNVKCDIIPLIDHSNNLVYRFHNKALGDTVKRVGKDTKRKLSQNDRLIGAINLCIKEGVRYDYLCVGVASGLLFNPKEDIESCEIFDFTNTYGAKEALKKYSNFEDDNAVKLIEVLYDMLKTKKLLDIIKFLDKRMNEKVKV